MEKSASVTNTPTVRPDRGDPAYTDLPAYSQAASDTPVDSQASSSTPAYTQSTSDTPVDSQASSSTPAYTQSTSDTPSYSEAASNTSASIYNFVRPSLLSSRLSVRCNDIDRYCFVSDHASDSKVWIHAGASKSNKALGCISFALAHNTFRIHCAIVNEAGSGNETITGLDDKNFLSAPLIDVVAGIGYPHPKTFTLKVPKGLDFHAKELVWNYQGGDITGPTPARYDLRDHSSGSTLLASLITTKEGKKRTAVQWIISPESELEQAVLIMSCIGIVTRLSRKGKFYNDKGMYSKWRYLWWMSTLSAVAVA
ncbi:hypothetical protein D6D29_04163 [Aureobasidium pullulans]|nr:hypothetical protein D6D29_04163 [Aureobasidium pullulans]